MTEQTTQPLYASAFQKKLHYFYDEIRLGTQPQAATFYAEEFCHFCENRE